MSRYLVCLLPSILLLGGGVLMHRALPSSPTPQGGGNLAGNWEKEGGAALERMRSELDRVREEVASASLRADVALQSAALGSATRPGRDSSDSNQPRTNGAPHEQHGYGPRDPAPSTEVEVLAERMEARLSEEVLDESWARAVEDQLASQDALRELDGLAGSTARCTDALCRVELSFDGEDALQDQLDLVPFHLDWASEGLVLVDSEDASRAVLYLAREGESLGPVSGN